MADEGKSKSKGKCMRKGEIQCCAFHKGIFSRLTAVRLFLLASLRFFLFFFVLRQIALQLGGSSRIYSERHAPFLDQTQTKSANPHSCATMIGLKRSPSSEARDRSSAKSNPPRRPQGLTPPSPSRPLTTGARDRRRPPQRVRLACNRTAPRHQFEQLQPCQPDQR